jgi:uncharacterized tellurite resistance protein B-like protein
MRGLVQIVFGLVLGVIGAIWAGPAKGMLAAQSTQLLGQYADVVPAGLVLAGGLYVITGVITMILSGIAKLFASGADRKKTAKRLDLFHELLTGATVRMVGVDHAITPAEVSMVSGVLEKFGQTPVPEKTIRSISESFVKDPDRYLNLTAEKSGELTEEQKTHILRACLLVAMSDVAVKEEEVGYLNRVAQALKISADKLIKIRDDMTNVTQKLVNAAAFAA